MLDSSTLDEKGRANCGLLKCDICHSCAPSGSADFLSESANRRVRMGLKLGGRREGRLSVERNRCVGQRTVRMRFVGGKRRQC